MGGEYTVGIVGDEVLPIIKIEPATEVVRLRGQIQPRRHLRYLCPCGLAGKQENDPPGGALAAFRILGGRGWGGSIS